LGKDFILWLGSYAKLSPKEAKIIGNSLLESKQLVALHLTSKTMDKNRWYRLRKGFQIHTQPKAKVPSVIGNSRDLKFVNIHPEELARQFTIRSESMFRAIPIKEFLNGRFEEKKMEKEAPKMLIYFEWITKLSGWVETEVLAFDNTKQRASVVKRWIQVAWSCRQLNNFSDMVAIMTGLRSVSVDRLKETWRLALKTKEARKVVANLSEIMACEGGGKNMRLAVQASSPPIIPFLPQVVAELIRLNTLDDFISEERAQTFLAELKNDATFRYYESPYVSTFANMVNWLKRRVEAKILQDYVEYSKSAKFNLAPVIEYQTFLALHITVTDSEVLYQRSRRLEPPSNDC